MTLDNREQLPTVRINLEGDSGVVEGIFGVMIKDSKEHFVPLAIRPLSGGEVTVTLQQVRDALRLEQWSLENAAVFLEGKVCISQDDLEDDLLEDN